MSIKGPIIIVDDDQDDQEMMSDALRSVGSNHEIKIFDNGRDAIEYLLVTTDRPFIIFCDINMPGLNGIDLRNEINKSEYLTQKSIPFIYYTTHAQPHIVSQAYYMSVQGFFEKPNSSQEMANQLRKIVDYWEHCIHPNKFSSK